MKYTRKKKLREWKNNDIWKNNKWSKLIVLSTGVTSVLLSAQKNLRPTKMKINKSGIY